MLRAGAAVGEAARGFERKHGETADVNDFLDTLAAGGLVARQEDAPDRHACRTRRARC